MPRYPAKPLEEKLAWMRERQRQKEEEAARQKEEELKKLLTEEKMAEVRQWMRLKETVREAKLAELDSPKYSPRCARPEDDVPPERKMLRIEKVALMLSVSPRTVQRWFADRAIVVHPGPRKTTMLISQKALDDWYEEHQAKPKLPV